MSETLANGSSAPQQGRHKWRPISGLTLRPSEVAAVRLNGKPGVEGNEVILRSGVVIPLSHQDAREVQSELWAVCGGTDGPDDSENPEDLVFVKFP